jgi:short-subunit dehydrogenase
VVVDLLDATATEAAFRQAELESGGFDVLINNAGAGVFAPLEAQTEEAVATQFRLLLHAPLQLMRLALPRLRTRNAGRILNVTSLAVRLPIPFFGPYNAAKAALSSASETLRHELCHTRIKIIDLQPGDIRSDFHQATVRQDQGWEEAYYPTLQKAWTAIDHNMTHAPSVALVVRDIVRAVTVSNPCPVWTPGDFFQTQLAPLAQRLLPRSLMEWAIQRFYKL